MRYFAAAPLLFQTIFIWRFVKLPQVNENGRLAICPFVKMLAESTLRFFVIENYIDVFITQMCTSISIRIRQLLDVFLKCIICQHD